jgi:hypothetical protein|uniref:Uncharacterized protein n=1 Tax=Picea glauca TaxID=3330 RepID=A0A101LWT5_PICGL|nr:hypothetical protein ABT39_MTgene1454 [Picea glauca]QHR92432.1 hypothetical protein Q903MT_gene6478 [Picea sitchensis]
MLLPLKHKLLFSLLELNLTLKDLNLGGLMAFKMLQAFNLIYILILLLGQELLLGLYLDLAIEMEGIEVLSLL